MLSSKGAEILEMIENNRTDEILDMDTFGFLESKNFIAFDGRRCAYVTPAGVEALEDYRNYAKSIKTASTANKLSISALVISFAFSIASLFVSIFC